MKLLTSKTCLLLTFAPLFAASPALVKPAVADKVEDVFVPAPFSSQKIEGILGARMRVNLEGRLLHVDETGIIEGFQHRPGKQDWIGEHAGKFLHAGTNVWLYTGDERLKTLIDRIARELIAAQLPDGYLGTYTNAKRWTSWDVWVHKYDLIGLLTYYQATNYAPALDASRKIGDLLGRTFGNGPGQRDIIKSGEHVGMAATSVLEPMVMLYRFTGEQRYLDFCNYILRAWEQPNGPHILRALNETGSVFHTANAKAYEMVSNLVGLTELYRVTGDPTYLRTAEIAWHDIREKRLYITGTSSSSEHFKDDFVLPGDEKAEVGEGCATVTWLQLSWQLLRLTGEPIYAEEIEHSVYNQLLGAQDPVNGNICYFTPLNGKKSPTPGINCCVSSEPRGISMIPSMTWGGRGGGIAVLLYTPGKVEIGKTTLESQTLYPLDGKVRLTVKSEKAATFPLYLRVPSWTDHYTAQAGGKSYTGKPGEFLAIEREWKPGDTVEIHMDLSPRLVKGGQSYPNSVAVMRGPQVLALEETLNPSIANVELSTPLSLTDANPPTWPGRQAYAIEAKVSGKPTKLVLVPFADARQYRVWM